MTIALAADHGGYTIKTVIANHLNTSGIEVSDYGVETSEHSADYPCYAQRVAAAVADGTCEEGILVCTTGIGMSIAANRFPNVRAALCTSSEMARTARTHNHANVLVLAGGHLDEAAASEILSAWLTTPPSTEERHGRRVGQIDGPIARQLETEAVRISDPDVFNIIQAEDQRQQQTLCLIASENHVSHAVRAAQGCVLTNKYAEGYPGKRWYNGCVPSDDVESLAISRAQDLFGAESVNVQPHSGSGANTAVYLSVLEPGDTVMAMDLAHGGHLTHGHPLNISGRLYNIVPYGVDQETEQLDYDSLARIAADCRPKIIVAGASAYPRTIDFVRFREIADSVGALFLADMAHIAGLVAGNVHPSPIPYADFVTTTTHKTLRGPRSGLIMSRAAFSDEVNRQVFPGTQGGPLMHTIAAKAVCFGEALRPGFAGYAQQIVRNAQAMAEVVQEAGWRVVSGGTDNHLFLVDVAARGTTGKEAANVLEEVGIVINKNAIPFDTKSPFVTSGIRVGTPAITTRGFTEAESRELARIISDTLSAPSDDAVKTTARSRVMELAAAYPAP